MSEANRRERRARQAIAKQATRRAIRRSKRMEGGMYWARQLMPEELRKLTERQLRKRERGL